MPSTASQKTRLPFSGLSVYLGLAVFSCLAAVPSPVTDFGSVAVSSSGSAQTITFNLTGVSTAPVLLLGGVDFTSTAVSCSSNFTVCTANATFTPKSVGLKQDALTLKTASGSLLASAFLHGIGRAPALRVLPAVISNFAGNGNWSYVDGAASASSFRFPQGLAIDVKGNLYIADSVNQVIRKIAAGTSTVTTYAGNGSAGFFGDGGPALSATMNTPTGVALDAGGNLFIADQGNGLVRRVDAASGVITTVAGGGASTANNVIATTAALSGPNNIAVDIAGNLYIADSFHNLLRKVTLSTGLISTIAGGGSGAGSDGIGDGGQATGAQLSNPTGLVLDAAGNLFFADTGHSMVRRVDATTGIITSTAGTGVSGRDGDGGLAVDATLGSPSGLRLDAAGGLYIADLASHVVRFVNPASGIISTLAGNGTAGNTGNGGIASLATLRNPSDVVLGAAGNLFIADYGNNVIRRVSFLPPTLTFPSTNLTLTSASIPVTIANDGNSLLTLSSLAVTAPFHQGTSSAGGDCSASTTLVPGLSCQILLSFSPTASGAVAGTVTIGSDDGNRASQAVVNLAGTGLTGYPVASLTPSALTFASQAVGGISSGLNATLHNTGTAALAISTILVAGSNASDFNLSATNCGSSLPAGATCTITITFSPLLSGARSALLRVSDAAANSPHTLTLSGTGANGAQPVLNQTALQFGSQLVSTASATQTVTLTNAGVTALGVSGISMSGANSVDFNLFSYTCGSTLAPSASCTITVRFVPTAPGLRVGSLVFTLSGGLPSQTVSLSGTGSALPCVTSISTSTGIYLSPGGNGSLIITAGSGCAWAAVSSAPWLVFSGTASGLGSANVAFTVSSNTTAQPRAAAITVGSLTNTVNQTGIGLRFIPITPCRLVDTRNANGPFGGPSLVAITPRSFNPADSSCGIPASAQSYSLNVAAVPLAAFHNLTIWPTGLAQPLVANLNSTGQVKSNAAIVSAGTNGAISVSATDATHLILDINGYFVGATNSAALNFYPVSPCRVADTRLAAAPLGGPFIHGGTFRVFPIQSGSCGVPSTAQAYSLNFAAIPRTSFLHNVTAWPAGVSQPLVSSLNGGGSHVIANAALVKAGVNGAISIFSTDDADLVIDIDGYFAPSGGSGGLLLYNVNPCRAVDTRLAGGLPFSGTRTFDPTTCPVPSQTRGYVFQAAVVPSSLFRNLSLWPAGTAQPLVATLNAHDSMVTSNLAILPTNNGQVNASANGGPTHLILDMFALFAP